MKDGFSCTTRFIQEATFRWLSAKEEWKETDQILILLTDEAKKRNWLDDGQKDRDSGQIIKAAGLNRVLSESGFAASVETIDHLPEGRNEKEIYQIFERIFNAIRDEDELYFDLTHAFRYLPMLVVVLGNYSKFLKNVSVKSISYGNWEMSEGGTKPAPIIDLLSISILQDWTFAAGQFIESGNAQQLIALSKNEYAPVLQKTHGDDPDAKKLMVFTTSLTKVVSERQSCRGFDIINGKSINNIKEAYSNLSIAYANPFIPLFSKISDTWEGFQDSSDVMNGIKAARWCYDKGLYLQAATLLEESVLYFFSERYGLNATNKTDQQILSGAFAFASCVMASNTIDSFSEESRNIGEQLLADFPGIIHPFQVLRANIRNDFNHAGIRKNPWKSETIISKLNDILIVISTILMQENNKHASENTKHTFINLSNHPSSNWAPLQLKCAGEYGTIVDIPFPDVDPDLSEEELEDLAQRTTKTLCNAYPSPATVHVMGEMTLTFLVVSELKSLGYTCLASTSERTVTTNEKGDKIVHFEFVRFRQY